MSLIDKETIRSVLSFRYTLPEQPVEKQEQPKLTQVPRIEQETQKKGWMDYGLLIGEIGLHRSNAIDRIKETKERAAEIKRNIAPRDLAILGEYLESAGAEIVLCCLQRYCMDFMFTQDEVKEILQQEQPAEGLLEEVDRFWANEFKYHVNSLPTISVVQRIARHFAEWGRKQVLQEIYDGKVKPVDKITAAWLDDEQDTKNDRDESTYVSGR